MVNELLNNLLMLYKAVIRSLIRRFGLPGWEKTVDGGLLFLFCNNADINVEHK